MACSVCSANVEKKLQSLEGINSASVSLASRTALVDYNPDIISLEDMKREISNAGYDLVIETPRLPLAKRSFFENLPVLPYR